MPRHIPSGLAVPRRSVYFLPVRALTAENLSPPEKIPSKPDSASHTRRKTIDMVLPERKSPPYQLSTNTVPPQSHPPTYKPSPLSYGSPRTSPFKRPESPASPFRRPDSPSSPSPAHRPATPTASPTKTPLASPYQPQNTATPPSTSGSWTPRGLTPSLTAREPPPSPTRSSRTATPTAANQAHSAPRPMANGDALSQLPATQVREMREGFQILDRDNDGW